MRLDYAFPKRVVTVAPGCPIHEVAELMEGNGIGAVVVTEDERPVGIVTDRDLALGLGAGRLSRAEPVRVAMSPAPATIGCHEGIRAAGRQLRELAVRRLPIVDEDGRLVGIVTLDDLLVLLGREIADLAGGVATELADAAPLVGGVR